MRASSRMATQAPAWAMLSLIIAAWAVAPAAAGPDLDVVYISRTPMHWRYDVQYERGLDPLDWWNGKPYLTTTEWEKQRWPQAGDPITYTAVIKNPGNAPTGSFAFRWVLDGVEVDAGVLPSIGPGAQTSTTWMWTWDSEWIDHTIGFVADPDNLVAEQVETNNARYDRTNALGFRLHVWQSVYNWFHTNGPLYDPNLASFEDWAQRQMGYMNQMMADAIYPLTPNGVLERVRLDEVVIEPDSTPDPDPWASHAPWNWNWDSRWGFLPPEYPQIWQEHPEFMTGPYSWILHEWGHQLGMIDLYQVTVDPNDNYVEPGVGHQLTCDAGLMNSTGDLFYSYHTAYALMSNLHKRRGYFGEYLYDVPAICRIRVVDACGHPLPGATVSFYQDDTHQVTPPADFIRVTDENGYITLPNDTVHGEAVTGTGHTIRDNPWGLIYVTGVNCIYFCQIAAGDGQSDSQFFEIIPFNVAYWSGHTEDWAYILRTNIVHGGRPTTADLLGIAMPSPRVGHAVGTGGTILRWDGMRWQQQPSPTTAGLWDVDTHAPDYAYAVGDSGTVLRYEHGTWTQLPAPLGLVRRFQAVAAPTPDLVVVGAARGGAYRTTDGGQTWTAISGVSGIVNDVDFFDDRHGLLVGTYGAAYTTDDGGASWTPAAPFTSGHLTGCCMASLTEAWACNVDGDIFRSLDGGATWSTIVDFGGTEDWTSIDMRSGGWGWVGGGRHEYMHNACLQRFQASRRSTEATITTKLTDTIRDVAVLSPNQGWIVGNDGLILRLGAWVSDADGDGDADADDLDVLAGLLYGPDTNTQADNQPVDIDGDEDVDLHDVAEFQVEFAAAP